MAIIVVPAREQESVSGEQAPQKGLGPVSAKEALYDLGTAMDSATIFRSLALVGAMERREYLLSVGSGEIKHY
ncbi:MAG: hypothetical protein K2W80_00410 [Burkholderiales bacterium]|nr:hypothetical protein [Burkholderiales bacterium]